jgi:Fe-S-cluster-containing dehydrogenase component/formate-dependent nitrite reductase membrane component NrfD
MVSSVQYGFVIDNRVCIGCHACTVACKSEHLVPIGVNRTWVKYVEKGEYPNTRRAFQVSRCNHCVDAPCVSICPTTALFSRDDGIVDFDNRRCIGCKACTQACPYDAIYIDPATHTAAKCNFCAHRIDQGLNPSCVNICPEQAIRFGDMNDPESDVARLIARENATVRKPEKGTRPSLYYIDGDDAALDPSATVPQSEGMWSNQSRGVGHNEGVDGSQFDLLGLVRRAQVTAQARGGSVAGLREIASGARDEAAVTAVIRELERDTAPTKARRAYDQPDKGVMWGWEVAAYVVTKAIGAGIVFAVMLPLILAQLGVAVSPDSVNQSLRPIWPLISLAFLGLTGALLVKDLDQPKRFLYVLLRPQWKSWLVRGAYILTAFGGLTTVWLASNLVLSPASARTVADWLAWPLALGALATAGYTGFLFQQAKGRDFWQSPGLVLHMIVHAPVAGFAACLIAGVSDAAVPLAVSLVLSLVLLVIEVWGRHPTADAAKVAHELRGSGRAGKFFKIGVLAAGHALPLLLLSLHAGIGDQVTLVGNQDLDRAFGAWIALQIPAAALTLVGLALAMYLWVYLPQRRPNV